MESHYLPPLILLIQQPGLQLSHHDLSLPLGNGTASLVVSGHQIVDVRQVGLFSGEDHHLVLYRHDMSAEEREHFQREDAQNELHSPLVQ